MASYIFKKKGKARWICSSRITSIFGCEGAVTEVMDPEQVHLHVSQTNEC